MCLKKSEKKSTTASYIPMKGIPTDSVRVPQSYDFCSFDYEGNLLSREPVPGDGAMVTADYDGRFYVAGLSVVSEIVYHNTPRIVRTTPKPMAGVWCLEPHSYYDYAQKIVHTLKNNVELPNKLTTSQKIIQLDGALMALEQAKQRKERSQTEIEALTKEVNALQTQYKKELKR